MFKNFLGLFSRSNELQGRIDNCNRYDDQLNDLEVSPNGDDYNNLYSMLNGAPYTQPHRKGR